MAAKAAVKAKTTKEAKVEQAGAKVPKSVSTAASPDTKLRSALPRPLGLRPRARTPRARAMARMPMPKARRAIWMAKTW